MRDLSIWSGYLHVVTLLEAFDYLDKLADVSCSLTHGPGMMKGLTFPLIKSLTCLLRVYLAKVPECSGPRRAGCLACSADVYNPTEIYDIDRRKYELYSRFKSYTGARIYGCGC
jgi:hypothetical protein